MSAVQGLLQQTLDLCRSASTHQDEDLKAKAARAVEFHKTLVHEKAVAFSSEDLQLLQSCENQLQKESDEHAGKQANGAIPTSSTENGTTHASLPPELYFTIAEHAAKFDFASRQSTLLSLSQVSREWSTVAVPGLFTQPKHLDTVARQLHFAFALFLDPSVARRISSLALRWMPGGANSKLLQLIVSRCNALKNLTLHRCDEADETEDQITQADIDALSAILSSLPHLQGLDLNYFGRTPEGVSYFLSAVDSSIQLNSDAGSSEARLLFPRSLTDQLRRLHSIKLSGSTDWYWPVLADCLGPDLQSLILSSYLVLRAGELDRIATVCQKLQHFELRSRCATHAEVSKLIESCGGHLKHIRITDVLDEEDLQKRQIPMDAMRPSVAQALAEHSKSLEVLILGSGVQIKLADVKALDSSTSCPALRTLSLQDIRESDDDDQQKNAAPHFVTALAAVVESHKDTLEEIELEWGRFEVGSSFVRACASLGSQIRRIDAAAGEGLDITLVDTLYRSHPRLIPNADLAGKSTLWESEWAPQAKRLEEAEEAAGHQDEIKLGS